MLKKLNISNQSMQLSYHTKIHKHIKQQRKMSRIYVWKCRSRREKGKMDLSAKQYALEREENKSMNTNDFITLQNNIFLSLSKHSNSVYVKHRNI